MDLTRNHEYFPSLEDTVDVGKAIVNLQQVWDQFLVTGVVPQGDLRPMIVTSWKRCLNFKVNPHNHIANNLSQEELDLKIKSREEYQEVIWQFIYEMEELAEHFHFVIAFADQAGFILITRGNRQLRSDLEQLNFRPGTNWSERYVGTNAIGTTLASGQPSQIFHAEHYCKQLQNHACTAVPVLNPFSHEVIGVLDFVLPAENHQSYTFALAIQTARCIELEIYRKEKEKEEVFRERSVELTLNEIDRGVIVVDFNDRIRRVNLKALEYLKLDSSALLNKSLSQVSIFEKWPKLHHPSHLTLPNGIELCLNSKPLIHNHRQIGSLIALEPPRKTARTRNSGQRSVLHRPIGRSKPFLKCLHLAEQAAQFSSNVLITGATGTGKEILARHIHENGDRHEKPFVALNCGSIPKELLGSELFGYEGGAFTGAHKNGLPSKFELANGGTLLLDEISEMPMESQVYLLRVIEEKALTRLGGKEQIPFDVRIIATSNRTLDNEVKKGRFRNDLLYRIKVLLIELPSLKERREDIPLFVEYFLESFSRDLPKKVNGISQSALDALMAYEWPGNIRELKNVIEQAIVSCSGETIGWNELPREIRSAIPIPDHIEEKERARYLQFLNAYRETNGNVTRVARALNISRPTVYTWMKRLELR
jgi:transcriptional regulator of acetoin/glycerol metabolism